MNIILIFAWSLFLCAVATLIIITFPASFARDVIKKGMQKIQKMFICIDIIVLIMIGLTNNPPNLALDVFFELPHIDTKVALMLIPAVACVIFSIFLYYPSVIFLVKSNLDDKKTIDKLIMLLFRCAYGENDNRKNLLSELDLFCNNHEQFVSQYGLDVYIKEYKSHATSISSKPPLELIKHVLDRIAQAKYDIDNYKPTPFPNIGLILSFLFSTVLTVLLSIVTINS